jgi:hypothetical protein
MSSQHIVRGLSTLAAVCVLGVAVQFARSADQPAKTPEQAKAEQLKMMEDYAKSSQPGPEHEKLKELAGEWNAAIKSWMPDGSPCGTGKGVMTSKMILGDRYLHQSFEATMTGPDGSPMPFKGMGISAYDKGKKKYTGMWIDEMSTGMMISEGTCDGNVMKSDGEFTDPVSGKPTKTQEITAKVDKDNYKYEMHMQGPDGKMYKCMEIAYSRK